jgi:cysteinyl-tRNA synthetase
MSKELLGHPFDIHTGGIDHREIHHPNEIAQNQAHGACDHSGAGIWMHNNFLIDRRGKMSKSSGEFLRLQTLVDRGFHPLAYRLLCLQAHYRSELEFSWEGLQAALVRLKRMVMAVEALKARHAQGGSPSVADVPASIAANGPTVENGKSILKHVQGDDRLGPVLERFAAAVADDLNTAVALTHLEEVFSLKRSDPAGKLALVAAMDSVLGLNLLALTRADLRIRPATATISEAEIEQQLTHRIEAKKNKNFPAADAIRDALSAAGVELMDGDPLGWDWKIEL